MARDTRAARCLDFLEAAYSWELDDEPWMRGVLEAAVQAWGRPHWACVYEYDVSDARHCQMGRPLFWGGSDTFVETAAQRLKARIPDLAPLYRTVGSSFGRPIGATVDADNPIHDQVKSADGFAINGIEGTGKGCFVLIGADRPELMPDDLVVFQRLAAHLGSAYRCRQRLRSTRVDPLDDSEAIIDSNGRLLEARGPAQDTSARDAIGGAARRIGAARSRQSEHDPTSDWQPRVVGRWTLIEARARQGERYIVARENQTRPPGLEALTDREQQVVASAATGRSPKEIAYELGIAHSTARVLLSRAYARLGIRSHKELFALKAIRALRGEPAD